MYQSSGGESYLALSLSDREILSRIYLAPLSLSLTIQKWGK